MSSLQTKAIVLKVIDYGESDKIITFYTESHGKLKAIAKGAKRSKKRFMNKLEFFSLLDITVAVGRRSSLHRIDQATLLDPFLPLREYYQRYTGAMVVCELIDQWTRENDSDEKLFQLLCKVLASLSLSKDIADTVIFFTIKMLDLLGLSLQLEYCTTCGEINTHLRSYRFNPVHSGIVCSRCTQENEREPLALSMPTLKILQMAQSLPWSKLGRLKISRQSRQETARALRLYCRFHLQRDIHSWQHFDFG
ncbi:MAG: DNA repair protein RecO [Desulfobulbaceae bacterium]|nr:DNA repair protein RecO [Desulfobulbaceae bacterium]